MTHALQSQILHTTAAPIERFVSYASDLPADNVVCNSAMIINCPDSLYILRVA
jgi:hypothetical protein